MVNITEFIKKSTKKETEQIVRSIYKNWVITFNQPKKESHNGTLNKTAQHMPAKKFPSSLFTD
ncbi:hypothetical protein AN964_02135 [Heyndrickxia shackletonii]|uniref:Uncharacterized protein n=1 Tax=Heyndrickxia shackletonii TaxID=157838 RepID=A0A0Q3TFQ6_9BACI|nr:hypothetical protein AN964_02135 [Heyndrickxia shackletonii]